LCTCLFRPGFGIWEGFGPQIGRTWVVCDDGSSGCRTARTFTVWHMCVTPFLTHHVMSHACI
jgi:hypothetical protein